MKTIILFIDHSKQSNRAGEYAIHLAKKIKANILVSEAITVSTHVLSFSNNIPAGEFEYEEPTNDGRLLDFCKVLEDELATNPLPGKFVPAIYCHQDEMPLNEVMNFFEESLDVAFIIVGSNLYYGASCIMAGYTCRMVMEFANSPVILVPEDAPIRYAEKYAYVADVNGKNVSTLKEIAILATYSAAEVMLVNINTGRPLDEDQENAMKSIMRDTIWQIDYGRIYYRHLPNSVLKSDLEWLMQDNRFEMLAVSYRNHGEISSLLQFDHTEKIIGNINVPLLIYPLKNC